MWIAKVPLRSDFCGCPPCPLCFDWADREGAPRIEGIKKFFEDMLGNKKPTKEQTKELDNAAERIHAANLARKEETPDDDGGRLQRFLNLKAKEARRAKPAVKRQPVLDHMDLEKPKQKKKEPEKAPGARPGSLAYEYAMDRERYERERERAEQREYQQRMLRMQEEMYSRMRGYADPRDPRVNPYARW